MTSTEKKELKSPLKKNKIVELVVVEKRPNTVMKSGADVALLKGASISFRLAKDTNGFLTDPLSDDERDWIENMLGFNLSVYAKNTPDDPNYWISHRSSRIKLTRTGDDLDTATVRLDLGNPIDFLRYKMCLVDPMVANKWAERSNPGYRLALRDVDDLDNEVEEKINKEDTVLEYLFKIKNSKKQLFNLYRLYGSDEITGTLKYNDQTAKWIYNQLRDLVGNVKDVNGLYNIISLDEESLGDRTFLQDGITCGMIVQHGTEYKLYGGSSLGYSEQEAIKTLNLPEYQNTKFKVQEAVDKLFKSKK